MSSSDRARRNVRLLLTARGVRAFGDGFVSILVPVYLTGIGFGAFEVGVLTTAMLLGPAMITLVIGLIAHRLKAVRLLTIAIALLLIRSTLSQMDVPARTSYVMAVVTPPERPAAASVTAAPRSIAGAASPVLAGYLLGLSGFGWPLVIGGGLNSLYDLLLLFMFRKVRPPEEQVLEDVHGDVASSYHVVDPSVTPTRS